MSFLAELVGAYRASWRARGRIDLSFAEWSQRTAWRLALGRKGLHRAMLVTPVSSMRYWEFPFAWAALPSNLSRCLDVASPRLFSLRAAAERGVVVSMINPDAGDAAETDHLARNLRLPITVTRQRIEELDEGNFDCVWSISVVEHIAGENGDSDAIHRMFDALRPGGRLILTTPVDRTFRLEYRDHDEYGLADGPGPFFFQRFYDEAAIESRFVDAVGIRPTTTRWFGERTPGLWDAYEREWMEKGAGFTIDDPQRMARDHREFESWSEMPGIGVCGLVFDKPDPTMSRSAGT